MNYPIFPFAAIVAADLLKLALCLASIDPRIGGVLISGPRGMAKSTLARAMAELLSGGEFVNLPLGATEERITGTLDLNAVLGNGVVQFSPGVLARADGGILYVDEVNLLSDHLVDVLLDVAASGVNVVERDGVSHQHGARFLLIGTMNPDEGELRPQLLDRFGLSVAMEGNPEPMQRAEITRRRISFDSDPVSFRSEWAVEQAKLILRCENARQLLDQIPLDDGSVFDIAQRCHDADVDGMRADIVWLRAARAHAAWQGKSEISREDIDAVAMFALFHRQSQKPSSSSKSNRQIVENKAETDGQSRQKESERNNAFCHPSVASNFSRSSPLEGSNNIEKQKEADWGAMPPHTTSVGPNRQLSDWINTRNTEPKKR